MRVGRNHRFQFKKDQVLHKKVRHRVKTIRMELGLLRIIKVLICFILVFSHNIQAQQIVNELVIPEFIKSPITSSCKESISHTEMMIEDKGRYYFKLAQCGENFAKLYDLEIEIEDIPVPDILSLTGEVSHKRESEILFEYAPGEGLIDYTIFNFSSSLTEFAIDGDHIVIAPDVRAFGLDNQLIYGDTIQMDPTLGGEDIIVYDKKNDKVLYHYVDQSEAHKLYHLGVGIHEDYIYAAPTFNANEMIFMGDTIQHYVEESGIQFTTLLYKINWKTGEVEWRHYIGSRFGQDKVKQIKVIDDGTLMVEIEINGPVVFDDEVYDPLYFGNGEVDLHNMAVMNISQEGEYINHLHIHSPGDDAIKPVQIEDSGEIYAFGVIYEGLYIQIENDTFDFRNEESFSGVFFSFDKNMNLKWSKGYTEGNHFMAEESFNGVYGANKTTDDEVIVTTALMGYTDIEGELYVNDYLDLVGQGQFLILKYDREGNLNSKPIKFGNRDNIYDFITLGENHYLIFIYCRAQYDNASFLGEEIGHVEYSYNMILEVEGDLFESLTSINEILELPNISIYPNPIQQGNELIVEIPREMHHSQIKIEVFTLTGEKEIELNRYASKESFHLNTTELSKGMKIIQFTTEGKKSVSKFLII